MAWAWFVVGSIPVPQIIYRRMQEEDVICSPSAYLRHIRVTTRFDFEDPESVRPVEVVQSGGIAFLLEDDRAGGEISFFKKNPP